MNITGIIFLICIFVPAFFILRGLRSAGNVALKGFMAGTFLKDIDKENDK